LYKSVNTIKQDSLKMLDETEKRYDKLQRDINKFFKVQKETLEFNYQECIELLIRLKDAGAVEALKERNNRHKNYVIDNLDKIE
jgi:hypothetical protein